MVPFRSLARHSSQLVIYLPLLDIMTKLQNNPLTPLFSNRSDSDDSGNVEDDPGATTRGISDCTSPSRTALDQDVPDGNGEWTLVRYKDAADTRL
jgi:hypothetical protein